MFAYCTVLKFDFFKRHLIDIFNTNHFIVGKDASRMSQVFILLFFPVNLKYSRKKKKKTIFASLNETIN